MNKENRNKNELQTKINNLSDNRLPNVNKQASRSSDKQDNVNLKNAEKFSDKDYIETCFSIVDKNSNRVPFLYNNIQKLIEQNMGQRTIIVKSRKLGCSSLILAKFTVASLIRDNTKAVVISHERKATQRLLDRVYYYLDNLLAVKPKLDRASAEEIKFVETNSSYWIGTAGSKAFGRGDDITHLHICLSGNELVVLKDGYLKKVKDIKKNDIVITGTGQYAIVEYLSEIENNESYKIKIGGYTDFPIIATPNHKFLIGDGYKKGHSRTGLIFKKTKDITCKDWMVIPRKSYKSKKKYILMDKSLHRFQNGGKISKYINRLELNKELGFFFGIYLAEGSIKKNEGCPSGIDLALHKKETYIINRIEKYLQSLGLIASVKKYPRKNSQSVVYSIFNSNLARTVVRELGELDNKHIPDIYFRCYRDFLDGLVEGYITGDGYIDKKNDTIVVTSVRPQLLIQLRNLLVSLYFGWSSMKVKKAGNYYGRNCKECFYLYVNGNTAYKLKQYFGWELKKDRVRKAGKHWKYDRKHIYVKIDSIAKNENKLDRYYDIVLSHKDHSFQLINCVSHNSELDWWENPEMLTGLIEAVVPTGIIVIETTGNGYGSKTHTMWQKAKRDESNYKTVFIPWFRASEYQMCVPKGFELTKEEKELKVRYNLSNEQLMWRRDKIRNMDIPELFAQEYPSNIQEAFFSLQESVFIPIEDVIRNINNDQHDKTSIKKITVCDVADEGADESVIYDLENTRIVNKEIYRHKDLMDTTGRVLAHAIKNGSNMAGIDIVGEGKGIFDRLNEIHPPGIDIYPFDSREQAEDPLTYFNKKAEAWHRGAKKFLNRRCDIPNDNILIEQLSGVTYIMESNGKIAVSPRKDLMKQLGHSPDRATAYIMGLYMLDHAKPVKKIDVYAEDRTSDYPFTPATV